MTQYGIQGTPVTIAATPPEPAPLVVPPGQAANEVKIGDDLEPVPAPPEPTAEERAAAKSALAAENHLLAEQRRVILSKAQALLPAWEDRAAKALIKSDYQKGQRDAVLACVADLRKSLGL